MRLWQHLFEASGWIVNNLTCSQCEMATVRDSDISLWLHNKLGTSNDSWTGGSICSQLNSEVLRNIKDCFPDLQTQVKLKLLLSFFHIPRRNVEEVSITSKSESYYMYYYSCKCVHSRVFYSGKLN